MNNVAHMMMLKKRLPHVRLKLLYSERQPSLVRVDRENDGLNAVALLQDLRGVFYALGPAQIAHVNQAINAFLDFDEGAEISKIAHAPLNRGANWIFLYQRVPGIGR